MRTLVVVLSVLMGLLGFGCLMAFIGSRKIGILLATIVYLTGAGLAYFYNYWWALIAALIIAHVLQRLGLDPGAQHRPGA